jgi:hypothetical protein
MLVEEQMPFKHILMLISCTWMYLTFSELGKSLHLLNPSV